jgi:hypothetical protein
MTDGIRLPSKRATRHVLSRALCRYAFFNYRGVPRRDRPGFIDIQLVSWAPFERTGHALVLGEDGCMTWAWDQDAFERRCLAAGLSHHGPIVPEPLFLASARRGACLQHCAEGVEGRVWANEELTAARWWPRRPDDQTWLNFLRGAGVAAEEQRNIAEVDAASASEWLPAPWAKPRTQASLLGRHGNHVRMALAACSLGLILYTAMIGKDIVTIHGRIATLERRDTKLAEIAGPVAEARRQALDSLGTLTALTTMASRPDILAFLAYIGERIPGNDSLLRELQWNGKQARMLLQPSSEVSRSAYVQALDAGWLHNVREEKGEQTGEGILLVGDLTPPRPQSTQPSDQPSQTDMAIPLTPGASGTTITPLTPQ